MRITHHQMVDKVIINVQDRLSRISRSQEQLSTGLRVSKPSDDPFAAGQILGLDGDLSRAAQYRRNIDRGLHEMRSTDAALGEVHDLLVRARSLAVQGANEATSAEGRVRLATQVDALIQELLEEANRKSGRRYLFGSSDTRQAPYTAQTDAEGRVITVNSNMGMPAPLELVFDDGERVEIAFTGDDVFELGGGDDVFDILLDLRQALESDDPDAVGNALPRLDDAAMQLEALVTLMGARVEDALSLQEKLAERQVATQTRISDLGDIDLAEAITRMNEEQTTYELALRTAAKVIQPSLVNFVYL